MNMKAHCLSAAEESQGWKGVTGGHFCGSGRSTQMKCSEGEWENMTEMNRGRQTNKGKVAGKRRVLSGVQEAPGAALPIEQRVGLNAGRKKTSTLINDVNQGELFFPTQPA